MVKEDSILLQLVYSTLRDTVLQVIIPILLGQVNESFIKADYDTSIVCKVRFEQAYLFSRTEDWDGFEILKSTDSSYLTNAFDGYFDDYSDGFFYKMIKTNFFAPFLQIHYGRTWVRDGQVGINIITKVQEQPIKFGVIRNGELFGTATFYPYFNKHQSVEADTIIAHIGFQRYFQIFVFLHEITHFRDYLQWKKYHPNEKVPQKVSEPEIDRRALIALKQFFPKIKYYITGRE